MFIKFMKFFNKNYHSHLYKKVGFSETSNSYERYSIRHYKCIHCGKTKDVDGRYDTVEMSGKVTY